MSQDTTSYLSLNEAKILLKLGDNYDNEDVLQGIVFDANQEIDNVLLPFADEIPIPDGDELFTKGNKLVLSYVKMLWATNTFQLDLKKEYQEIYNEKRKTLIETLKANRTTRTKRATVGTEYRTRRMFSQIKRY